MSSVWFRIYSLHHQAPVPEDRRHRRNSLSICRHILTSHDASPTSIIQAENFKVLKKCHGKMDCPIYEMLFIKKYNPCFNVQSDSIKAKVFIWILLNNRPSDLCLFTWITLNNGHCTIFVCIVYMKIWK